MSRGFYFFQTNTVTKNSLWMMAGQAMRLLIQGAFFVLLARKLGAVQFGVFMGGLALVRILVPFSGLGTANVMIRHVASSKDEMLTHWGNAIGVTLVSGLLLTAGALLFAVVTLPNDISVIMVLWVALAELLLGRILQMIGQLYQASDVLVVTAAVDVAMAISRLTAAVFFRVSDRSTIALEWSGWYLAASGLPTLLFLGWVIAQYGWPRITLRRWKETIREGVYFSFGTASKSAYSNLDKAMLSKLATLEDVGVYSAASRITAIASAPIEAILTASYAQFFRVGARGLLPACRLARKIMVFTSAYGVLVAVSTYLIAPLVPLALGRDYVGAAAALRFLALVPLIQSIYSPLADALTGSGFQSHRAGLQVVALIVNFTLNRYLIPIFSWRGAAWATLVSELLLCLLIVTIVTTKLRAVPEATDIVGQARRAT